MKLEELLLQEYTASRTQFSQILNDATVKMGFECEMLAEVGNDDDQYDDEDDDDDFEQSDEYQEYLSAMSDYENWEGSEEPEFNDMTYQQVMDTEGVSVSERDRREITRMFQEWKDNRVRDEWDHARHSFIPRYLAQHPGRDKTDAYHSWLADRREQLPNPDNDEERDDDIDAFIHAHYDSMDDFMSEVGIDWEDPNERPERPDEPDRPDRGRGYYRDNNRDDDTRAIYHKIAQSLEDELGVDATTHQTSNLNTWRVVRDGSIKGDSGVGAEVVSGVFILKDGLSKMQDCFRWMTNNNMETNTSTGLHVSFSIDGKTSADDYDFLKMMILFDENYTASIFDRLNEYYAVQMRDTLFRDIQHNDPATLMSSRHIGAVIAALKHMGRSLPEIHNSKRLGASKYFSFRHRAKGVIEFRNMGSTDYQDKFDVIRQRVINMAYIMKVGSDDSLMQREYLTRVYAMLTRGKFETSALKKSTPVTIPFSLSSFTNVITSNPRLAEYVRVGDVQRTIRTLLQDLVPTELNKVQIRQLRFLMAKNKLGALAVRKLLDDDGKYNLWASLMVWQLVVPGDHPEEQEPLPFVQRGTDLSGHPQPEADDDRFGDPGSPRNSSRRPHLPHAQTQTFGRHEMAR